MFTSTQQTTFFLYSEKKDTEFLVAQLLKNIVFPNWKFSVKGGWKRNHNLSPPLRSSV